MMMIMSTERSIELIKQMNPGIGSDSIPGFRDYKIDQEPGILNPGIGNTSCDVGQ